MFKEPVPRYQLIIGSALRHSFIGPARQPKRWDKPHEPRPKLLSRDFVLLFLMAMCSNSYIAVYYCFEQWMQGLGIAPAWRGVLLSSLFAMILLFRPLTSIILLKHGKLWSMLISLVICTLVMLVYPLCSRITPSRLFSPCASFRALRWPCIRPAQWLFWSNAFRRASPRAASPCFR